jgi:peptidyl-Lys metalloendopeptidase
MDTYQGDNEDPLSLHKYLYCEGNPVNGTDPTGHDGEFQMWGMLGDLSFQIAVYKPAPKYLYYGKLTSAQQTEVNQAIDEARKYADEAVQHMNTITYQTVSARYVRWFGSRDKGRIDHVKDVWNKVDSAMWQPLTVMPTTGDYYGLTWPLFTSTIRLGNYFWDRTTALTGEDSKAGTIIHEVTHLVGGTDDKYYDKDQRYTVEDAKNLAIFKPSKATKNANNYEYFVELK